LNIKKVETTATKVMSDMEKNSLVTFGLNAPQTIEIDGEIMTARPIDCYNWKIILNDEKVIINPAFYDGDLKPIDVDGDLWVFFNTDKVVLYNNTKSEFIGEVTGDLDPKTHSERVQIYLNKKEMGLL